MIETQRLRIHIASQEEMERTIETESNEKLKTAYTKYKYNKVIKKIAIVDFDVHHGNGTEEIIQMLNYKKFSKS